MGGDCRPSIWTRAWREAAKLCRIWRWTAMKTSEKNDRDAKSALQEYLQALGRGNP